MVKIKKFNKKLIGVNFTPGYKIETDQIFRMDAIKFLSENFGEGNLIDDFNYVLEGEYCCWDHSSFFKNNYIVVILNSKDKLKKFYDHFKFNEKLKIIKCF